MADQKGDNLAASIFGDSGAANGLLEGNKGQQSAAPATGEPPAGGQDDGQVQNGQLGTGQAGLGQPGEQQGQADKKYAGKFESDEELEKAYLESQRFMTQKAQEAAEYRRQLEQLQRQLQQVAAPDMTRKQQEEYQNYVKKAINAAVVDEDPSMLLQLIEQLTESKTEQKLRQIMPVIEPIRRQNLLQQHVEEFFTENPEDKDLENEMAKLVQTEPDLVYDAHGNVRANWPYRVYAKILQRQSGAAKKLGAAAAAQAAATKAAAAAPGSTARAVQQQPESEEDKLKQVIFGDDGGKRRMFDY